MRFRRGRVARTGVVVGGLIAAALAGAVLGAHGGTSDMIPAPKTTITRPITPGSPANPRLVITIKGHYKYTAVATAPVAQQDLRTWTTEYNIPFVFGTSSGLYMSDLRAALSRQQSLLATGEATQGTIGGVEKHTTVGDCSQIIISAEAPSLEVDAVIGRTLVVALDFPDYTDFEGTPCIGDPGGITVASPTRVAGKCSWDPKEIPGFHFTNQSAECFSRSGTLYFTLDVDKLDNGKPVPTQKLKYDYSFGPTDPKWQDGSFSSEISWDATVSIKLVKR